MAQCRICGAQHASCGPVSTVVPVDHRAERREGDTMTLKRYETTINGHKTTLLLSPEEAKRQGLTETAKPAGKAAPTNKAARAARTK